MYTLTNVFWIFLTFIGFLKNKSLGLFFAELGASLFEIAQSLFAFEQPLILGAMALDKNKSEEQWANWQNPNYERFAHERYKD